MRENNSEISHREPADQDSEHVNSSEVDDPEEFDREVREVLDGDYEWEFEPSGLLQRASEIREGFSE